MTNPRKTVDQRPEPSPIGHFHIEAEVQTETAEAVGKLWGRAREAAFAELRLPVVVVQDRLGMRMLVIHEADLLALPEYVDELTDLLPGSCD